MHRLQPCHSPWGAWGGAGCMQGPALSPGSNKHTRAVACSPDFAVNDSPSAIHTSCCRHPNLPIICHICCTQWEGNLKHVGIFSLVKLLWSLHLISKEMIIPAHSFPWTLKEKQLCFPEMPQPHELFSPQHASPQLLPSLHACWEGGPSSKLLLLLLLANPAPAGSSLT